ncbi:hypothetical protein A9Q81_19100 [Gammaproteobacteria bacterium 42_54_T18]|nr:hypothetical protein A9Q81_19100 [Gammaproteobacteria bacterium 42_54_T18]
MNKWQQHRWYIAWAIWLVLIVNYLDYSVDRAENTSDITNIKRVEVIANMKVVSLPEPPPTPVSQTLTQKKGIEKAFTENKQSRLWLSKLEAGEGPDIVFTWPTDVNERAWIQQRLYNCGVRLGKWSGGRLRAIEVGVGTVSGFIRVISGEVSVEETSRLQTLVGEGQPVRLFPRSLDIHLLTQLSNTTSGKFMAAKHVSAEYKRHMEGVNIRNIQVDGQAFEQGVGFLPESGQCS